MLKMECYCFLALICSLALTGNAGLERVKLLRLISDTNPVVLQPLSKSGSFIGISVENEQLDKISSSVLAAESWLRNQVLTHYPGVQITTIVVGNDVLCNNSHEDKWDFVLPAVKNIYHSLVRWGLEKDIKASAALSTECLHPFSYSYREDLVDRVIKPLLSFLQNTNLSFSVNAPSDFSPLVNAFTESTKRLGFFQLSEINVVISSSSSERKPKSRKLSFLSSSNVVEPFPARPTPLPIHSSIGFSVPANIARTLLSPLAQTPPTPFISTPYSPQISPLPPSPPMTFPFTPQGTPLPPTTKTTPSPSMSFSFAPQSPPLVIPSNPPDGFYYPPCSASPAAAPTPRTGEEQRLWCVAKPSVPEEKLKVAMDYACGLGGADCEEIRPHGSCYYPDTMVAHASYAFNSYWQKNKKNGGTCSFGGTAMVINANPSFQQCRFILS
ncbi:hypothetical protein IFM89_016685 [Coptis chinensis]|uniref:X8 domain-containing protein n=1 Tax=Coptis chinensis TaxID=261450 RepID=A0A835MEU7_9MAGN|nr:hypothetical protein IFM89_016685 [Coptis chinensis]